MAVNEGDCQWPISSLECAQIHFDPQHHCLQGPEGQGRCGQSYGFCTNGSQPCKSRIHQRHATGRSRWIPSAEHAAALAEHALSTGRLREVCRMVRCPSCCRKLAKSFHCMSHLLCTCTPNTSILRRTSSVSISGSWPITRQQK